MDDPALSIVDVPGYGGDYSDEFEEEEDEIEEDLNENENSENNEISDEENRAPKTKKKIKTTKKKKKRNGLRHIDMTPPEKLLKLAERDVKELTNNEKNDEAIRQLTRCVALTRIVYGDKHWKHAQAYSNLAQGYFDLKGYAPQAYQHAETAKNIMMSGLHTSQSDSDKAAMLSTFMDIYYTMGRSCSVLKKQNEAEQAFLKADSISKQRLKSPSVSVEDSRVWDIKIAIALAKVNLRQQKQAGAMTYYEHAKDLITKSKGADSLDLIPIYQGMGQVEQSKGKHANQEHAIEMYLQGHSIASAHYKTNSVELASTAKALASAYSNTADPHGEASAESYLNECLAMYQLHYGPNHEKTIGIHDELAKLMIRTDRKTDSISLLKSTIPAKQEVFGEFSDETADTNKLIASIHLSNGNMELALKAFRKCLSIQTMMYGSNHKKTKETQANIDVLLANPNLAAKDRMSSKAPLSDRPRFSSIVSRSKPVAGSK
ncbi:tetratricopeptide repeat protein 23-like [Tubulanus polymorphus]|uniref:tetratricopeptide repeat protein 23-like n=1 Tax=Tubulanus polymorphus TaxID=672921 RepID=UPI003DA5E157